MQQLQATILNSLRPGKVPIFIVSPNPGDGDSLALLLSNNLIISHFNSHLSETSTASNYFTNANIKRTMAQLNTAGGKKIDSYRDSLKFFIEEGIESNSLWGTTLTYKLFIDLDIPSLFKQNTTIILYSTNSEKSRYSDDIFEFYLNHQADSFLFNIDNIVYLPQIVLSSLPYHESVALRHKFLSNTQENKKKSFLYSHASVDDHKYTSNNWLLKQNLWYKGDNILAIIAIDHIASAELIINKVYSFINYFLTFPSLAIICRNEDDKHFVNSIIDYEFKGYGISIEVCNSFAIALNAIIGNSAREYIIIDNLALSYSFLKMVSPFRRTYAPSMSIALPQENVDDMAIQLTDVLLRGFEIENLAFVKSNWSLIAGFDPSLKNQDIFWDFGIRMLQIPNSYVVANSAAPAKNNLLPTSKKVSAGIDGSMSIFRKHINVYQENIDKVISKTQELSGLQANERILLVDKVATAESFAAHSNDQAKLLLDLSNSLKDRIKALENRWHYKLRQKINWLKRIFFSQQSGKSSRLVKILKFIIFSFTRPGLRIFRAILKSFLKKLYLLVENRPIKIVYLDVAKSTQEIDDYDKWIRFQLNEKVLWDDYNSTINTLKIKPKISILMPVYDPPLHFLKEAIESVINQTYENWEFCIADDCSPNPQIQKLLRSYVMKDPRIKVEFRKENGHISASSNSALALATGDYVLLLDHDDTLTQNCLFEVVKHINAHPQDKLIYSDEDKVDEKNKFREPFFKPDWSPDKLLANNYISHIAVVEKSMIDSVKGFRIGYEGSQDYDLMLRVTEQTNNIGHIPKILYHWRIHEMSVAGSGEAKPYAYVAAKKALASAFLRRNISAEVLYTAARGSYKIRYNIKEYQKVSIIIPTKDAVILTKNTIDSIFALTSYPDYEIIVLNNNSSSAEFFELMNTYKEQHSNFHCIDANFPFNFSKLINLGVSQSNGKYILMLNNDVEVLQENWLTEMVSYSQNERTGAVGVKLLYPDDTIQHAGVVIGFGPIRVAGHVFLNQHKDSPGYFNYLQTAVNYSAVTAACLMCRKDVFEEVGGMNEDLEVEYNDVDFCLKLREHGYFNLYVPDVVLYHYESATRGHPKENRESYARHIREVNYFKSKWVKYIQNDPFYNLNLSLDGNGFNITYLAEKKEPA